MVSLRSRVQVDTGSPAIRLRVTMTQMMEDLRMRKFLLATAAAGIIGLAAPLSVLAQATGGAGGTTGGSGGGVTGVGGSGGAGFGGTGGEAED